MTVAALHEELALANRLLANEGVLDAFGHVSCRHPEDPGRYLLAAALPPVAVQPGDILEFDLEGRALCAGTRALYSERVIHSEIYRARPDVGAIIHHHAADVMPFCIADVPLVPVTQTGACMGGAVPVWDSAVEFGDTNLLLTRPEEGAALARALGAGWMVLMRRHGATVAGRTLREAVFRAIHSAANARALFQARLLGPVRPLSPGEIRLAGADLKPAPVARTWEHALTRLRQQESGTQI